MNTIQPRAATRTKHTEFKMVQNILNSPTKAAKSSTCIKLVCVTSLGATCVILGGCYTALVESDIHAFEQTSQYLSAHLINWASMSQGATVLCSAQQLGDGSPSEVIDGYLYGGDGSVRYWYPGETQQGWVVVDFHDVHEITNILLLTWVPGGGYGVREYSVDGWDDDRNRWHSAPILGTSILTTSGFGSHSVEPTKTSRIRFNVHRADGGGPVVVEIAAFGPARSDSRASDLTSKVPTPPAVPPVPPPPGVSLRSASKTRIVAAGISAYSGSGIPKVDYGAGDAKAFATFAQQAGVPAENITTLIGENATRSRIIGAINNLKTATIDKSETAVFYFSGHGAPLVKDGSIYASVIVPYDASEQDLEHTGINLDLIREKLGDLPGSSIVILDACFTGKEGRSVMAKNLRGLAIVPRTTNIVSPPATNTWWLTATSGDNFANDLPRESHGLFTYYLLKALSGEQGVDTDQDGLITIKEAFAWMKEKVTTVSAKSLGRLQVPELIGNGDTTLTMPR